MTKIQILTTGGTIEGLEYDQIDKAPKKSHIGIEYHLRNLNGFNYNIKTVFAKDSRFISKDDRKLLVDEIHNAPSSKILITHGTFSMVETAKYIAQFNLNRTIILTGAFILGNNPNTDATFNLYYALNQFEQLKSGVFIAIHNETFKWNNVRKNVAENKFEKLI